MSRYPGVLWRPLPEAGAPDGYDKTQFIVHSTGTVASAAANARYFARPDVSAESNFIVGLTPNDPTLQVMDSTDKADANTTASRRGISVEVVGTGDMPFTQHQIDELVRLGRLAYQLDGIPLRECRTHDDPGFGWHVMFGAPGPWTTVKGKVCPGGRRVAQLRDVVFPAIFGSAAPPPPGGDQEDDMDTALTLVTVKDKPAVALLDGRLWHAMHDVSEWQALVAQGVPLIRVSQRVYDQMAAKRTRGA